MLQRKFIKAQNDQATHGCVRTMSQGKPCLTSEAESCFQLSPAAITHLFRAVSENISPRSQVEGGENSSDTGRANSTPGKAHGGTAFSAEQLSTAQTWWFCSSKMCLAELTSFLLDCVNVMAVQLKCNLNKWCCCLQTLWLCFQI